MNSTIKTLLAAAGLAFAIGGVAAGGASAATPWQVHHPRRVEVNLRLDRQNERIRHDRLTGKINAYQAFRLHQADQRVREQERWFALHHGGHITRGEQMRLNQRENHISHRIR